MGYAAPNATCESSTRAADTYRSLPDEIRQHLGRLLADNYAPVDDALGSLNRFSALLADLDTALGEARQATDSAFRSGLLGATPALRRFALSLTHDATAADDLVQDTLLRAWRNRTSFVLGTNLEAWTFTILRNQFYTDRRKHGREVQDEDGGHAARLAVVPNQTGHVDLQDLRRALDRINPTMREALLLVVVEDRSYEEAAAVMQCQVGTVKSRVSRARAQLALVLGYGCGEVRTDDLTLSAMEAPT